MPRKKKATFTPKKKKTLIKEPNWDRLSKAKTEEARLVAWKRCDDFVQFEVTEKECAHGLRFWIMDYWKMDEEARLIPETYLVPFAKNGYKWQKLGWMPEIAIESLEKNLKPLVVRARELKDNLSSSTINNNLLNLDKDAKLHPDTVKGWLKTWKNYLKSIKNWEESKDAKQRIEYQTAHTYVYNMSIYLRDGIWLDSRFGENREYKIKTVCKALAFDEHGNVKRTPGVYYPDIAMVWED